MIIKGKSIDEIEAKENNKIESKKNNIILLLLLSGLLVSACSFNDNDESKINKPEISDDFNEFDKYTKFVIRNGNVIQIYKGENIAFAIDNDTNQITEYVYNNGFLISECYELKTGDMILYSDLAITRGKDYYLNVIENSTIINLIDIADYIEGETCKEWYTMEELEELKPQILDSVFKLNQFKKIKKLEK